ncbi:MAG: hypothetical protein ACR2PY_01530 [Salinispira sp.]
MIIEPPKYFGPSSVSDFLEKIEFVFFMKEKPLPDFHFNLHRVKEAGLIGQLLIYKFIAFTATEKCFVNPQISLSRDNPFYKDSHKTGFLAIIKTYIRNPTKLKKIRNLPVRSRDNLLIAPKRLIRKEEKDRARLESKFLTQINKFYSEDKCSIVSTCLSELISNFWSHATEEANTVMVAHGSKKHIQICFADNGEGIVTTLNKDYAHRGRNNKKKREVFSSCVERGVTSKLGRESGHMGCGLFFISEFVKHNSGEFDIYSEGYWYHQSKEQTRTRECAHWKGTIIFVSLNLDNPKNITQMGCIKYDKNITINWGIKSC